MKGAKQIVFICIGAAMILLAVGLIFAKNQTIRQVDNEAAKAERKFLPVK